MRWIVPRASIAACGWIPPFGTAMCSTRGGAGVKVETSTTASTIALRSMRRALNRMPAMSPTISRRDLLTTLGGAVCAHAVLAGQAPLPTQTGPTVVSNPPRDFGPNATLTTYFPDPDVITVDPAFGGLIQGNTPIRRLWTGALWMEGPAWNGQGRYLVWSDIPNNRQYRWMEDDGH